MPPGPIPFGAYPLRFVKNIAPEADIVKLEEQFPSLYQRAFHASTKFRICPQMTKGIPQAKGMPFFLSSAPLLGLKLFPTRYVVWYSNPTIVSFSADLQAEKIINNFMLLLCYEGFYG